MCDSDRRFGGIGRLYGKPALVRFQQAHICVIGVGGVGSWAVEALARSAIGRLTLIDMDHVAESNTNRQLQATSDNLGKSKIKVLAERIEQINPACRVSLIDDYLSSTNLAELINDEMDCVIDCIDDFRLKAALINYCKLQQIRLICTGGAGGRTDPGMIQLSDLARTEQDPLLSKTRALLRHDFGFPRNPKKKFKVDCIWSNEQLRYPTEDGHFSLQKPGNRGTSTLNCGGLGSAMPVTATFAQFAVAAALKAIS